MNYQKVYDQLISSRLTLTRSKKTGVFELHHIVPKTLGGGNDASNLILLTPREHFLAHYLLWKIHKIRKLRDAILYFKGKHGEFSASRLYEAARISHIHEMKNNNPSLKLSEESKERKRNKLKSYIKTETHRKNISRSKKGSKPRLGAILQNDSKKKISQSLKDFFANNTVSDETRKKISASNLGKKHSAESIKKQKEKALNRKKYQCPHCVKQYDAGNLKQHMLRHGYSEYDVAVIKNNILSNQKDGKLHLMLITSD